MADLDDFFAKKDRKKSKTKKFATAEELAKKIEDTTKKSTEVKPRKVTSTNTDGIESKNVEPVEEEWKEFEEERKDYSGLKLAQLNMEDDHNQGSAGNEDGGSGMDGGDGDRSGADSSDRKAGAWKKVESTSEAPEKPSPGLYVSRNLRGKLKKGVAPDLKNEEYFPTLGTDQPDPTKSKKDSTFEEVKHGGRVRQSDLPSAAPLSVGNRFTSLSNDAS